MAFPTSPRRTYRGSETIDCRHEPTCVAPMTTQGSLAFLSGEDLTGLGTYVTEDRNDMLRDLTPKVMREQTSGHYYLTETAWIYATAMNRRLLLEMLSMTDTMDRILGMRDSYLATIDWTDLQTTAYSVNSKTTAET